MDIILLNNERVLRLEELLGKLRTFQKLAELTFLPSIEVIIDVRPRSLLYVSVNETKLRGIVPC